MAGNAAKSFRAVLERLQGGLGWVIARVPFNVETTWKNMLRHRVAVEVEGELFRTSLFPYSDQSGYFILVNKKMQKAAGTAVGGKADFTVAPDLDERVPNIPPELAQIFKAEKKLAKWFAGLSESTRHEGGKWIESVKSPESRQRRAEQLAERLMLTMEGEKELPPILQVAFRETPAARKGWDDMTLTQKRGHLMGIFYYQSPEARKKRVGKVIDEALRVRS
jgi:uncharacterized protein YdeI (YjbR/CyaY-like superfamily)